MWYKTRRQYERCGRHMTSSTSSVLIYETDVTSTTSIAGHSGEIIPEIKHRDGRSR